MCRRNQAPSPKLSSKLVDALTRELFLISHGMLFAYDRPLRARSDPSITAHNVNKAFPAQHKLCEVLSTSDIGRTNFVPGIGRGSFNCPPPRAWMRLRI
jgi:hypothetical protein